MITYAYDDLYRLRESRDNQGEIYAYTYDAAGNRLTKNEPGESVTVTYDAANQIATINGVPMPSDSNGNLLSDGQ